MFELPTQPSGMVLQIANFLAIIQMMQHDNDTDWEISNNEIEDPEESALSSDIEEDILYNQQEDVYQDQAHRDKTIRITQVPLPKKRSRADTLIARAVLPNLWHPAGAIAPPLLKRQKSNIIIIHVSDVLPAQVLPLPEAGGNQIVSQPKAGGDHNVPRHQKEISMVAKWFIEGIVFSKTPWPIISNDKYSMVSDAWKLAIETQDHQRALAGAPVGTQSVFQLPSGPSLKINPQAREVVSV